MKLVAVSAAWLSFSGASLFSVWHLSLGGALITDRLFHLLNIIISYKTQAAATKEAF